MIGVRVLAGLERLVLCAGLVAAVCLGMAHAALAAGITPGTVHAVAGTSDLDAVACPSATGCIAIGSGSSSGGVVVPLAPDGTPGTPIAAPASFLLEVACGSATSCVAVGGSGIGSVVTIDSGTPGTLQTVTGTEDLGAVACTSASTCLALGAVFPFAEVTVPIVNGTAGTYETLPGPAVALDGVACPSPTSCIAVGAEGSSGVVVPLSPSGTPGAVQTVAGTSDLERVACPSVTSCVAVGADGPSGAVVVPLSAGGTPGTVQPVAGTHALAGVTCTSSSCVAVGNVCTGGSCLINSDFAGQVVPIAADGTPGTPVTVAGTEFLTGAACTSATSCVAVGANSANGVVVPLATQGGGGGAPANTAPPTVSGAPRAGATLTCSTGTWTNDPTSYAYQWYLDGTPIQAATSSSYVVQTGDEQLTLTCSVIASSSNGAGAPATTGKGATVPVPHVARCPAATGKLSSTTLGLVRLGMARAQARHAYTKSSNRGKKYEDFFCLTPIGVRVGYGSAKLPKKYADRVIWASTSSAYYTVHGIRVGATVIAAAKVLKLTGPIHVGLNDWYLTANGASTAVFKVRDGIIEEIGIADRSLTKTTTADRTFLKSFS